MKPRGGAHSSRRVRDTLAEVVSIGIGNGLTTMGILMPGHRFEPEPMRCEPAVPRTMDAAEEGRAPGRGIAFDIEGFFDARLGMLLGEPAADALAQILVPKASRTADMLESALAETGNIFASAFVTAVGDLLGEILFIGPPCMTPTLGVQHLGIPSSLGWLVRTAVCMDGGPQRFELAFWVDEDNATRVIRRLAL